MSDIDVGGLLGTVIIGGVAIKMTESVFGGQKQEQKEQVVSKKKASVKKINSNAYARQNSIFGGNNSNSPW